MELILAILFFSVASAVCVEFFVKSHLMSRDSDALTHTVNECASIAELICTSDSLAGSLQLLQGQYGKGDYPASAAAENAEGSAEPAAEADVRLYYDASFMPCGQESSAYVLQVHLEQEEQMIAAVLEMCPESESMDEEPIYRLQAKHHIARRTERSER